MSLLGHASWFLPSHRMPRSVGRHAHIISPRGYDTPRRRESALVGDCFVASEGQGRPMIEVMPISVTVSPLTLAPGVVHCSPILMRWVPAATSMAVTPLIWPVTPVRENTVLLRIGTSSTI